LPNGWEREENICTLQGYELHSCRSVNKSSWRKGGDAGPTFGAKQWKMNFIPGKANAAQAEGGRVCGGLNL